MQLFVNTPGYFDIDPIFLNVKDLLTQFEHPPILSDHLSFYLFGVKDVIVFTEASWVSETEFDESESNIAYHTEEETVGNINFDYMSEIVKLYIASLAREAGIIGRR